MIRRALLLLAMTAVYMVVKRIAITSAPRPSDRAADSRWENEGGANAPTSV